MDLICSLVVLTTDLCFALVLLQREERLTPRNFKISGTFLGLRIAYTFLYIGVDSQNLSHLRSLAWMGSIGCCLTLLVKAGNVLV